MHKKIFRLVLLFLFFPLFPQVIYGQLVRTNYYTITVEQMDTALAQIAQQGTVLHSHVNNQEGVATVNLRIPGEQTSWVYDLGHVTESWSTATNVFGQVQNLQAELAIREQEYTRLIYLLETVETLAQFNTIEQNLVGVIQEIEWLTGQLNLFNLQTATTTLDITLRVEASIINVEASFFNRLGQAFIYSLTFIQSFILLITRFAIQLIFIGLIIFGGLYVKKIKFKKAKVNAN